MRRFVTIVTALSAAILLLVVPVAWERLAPQPEAPAYGVITMTAVQDSDTSELPPLEPPNYRWTRVNPEELGDEHHASLRDDWIDNPAAWKLVPLTASAEIPQNVRAVLVRRDCVVPQTVDGENVLTGEFERTGQQDLVVLCAHSDSTSTSYIFWNRDPARMEVAPWGGSSLSLAPIAALEDRIDFTQALEPGTPEHPDHDGIEVGCCECCSTLYYRHAGGWLALQGAD